MQSPYAQLSRLPLLQGISSKEMEQLSQAMEVEELPALSAPIIRQGETCGQLIFLVEGQLRQRRQSPDGIFEAWRTVEAPCAIEPESLYALSGTYRCSYQTLTPCRFISLRRGDVTNRLMRLEVFRINYINALSLYVQRCHEQMQPVAHASVEERFWHFVASIFPSAARSGSTRQSPAAVNINIRMRDLAAYLGETRLTVSRLLNRLQAEGRVALGRGSITTQPHP